VRRSRPRVSNDRDIRRIHRGCKDKAMRQLLLSAVRSGAQYRMTKSGVMFRGPDGGGISTHFTGSDHRAPDNFRKSLKSIGITIEKRK
jgi:hypothetical protein